MVLQLNGIISMWSVKTNSLKLMGRTWTFVPPSHVPLIGPSNFIIVMYTSVTQHICVCMRVAPRHTYVEARGKCMHGWQRQARLLQGAQPHIPIYSMNHYSDRSYIRVLIYYMAAYFTLNKTKRINSFGFNNRLNAN